MLGGEEALARDATASAYGGVAADSGRPDRVTQLEQEVAALRAEVAALAAQVAELRSVIE